MEALIVPRCVPSSYNPLFLYAEYYQDIYEFIQRRSDWKKIEKTVDKTMYNLSFKEDCVVCRQCLLRLSTHGSTDISSCFRLAYLVFTIVTDRYTVSDSRLQPADSCHVFIINILHSKLNKALIQFPNCEWSLASPPETLPYLVGCW
jgi:hypothetical protein